MPGQSAKYLIEKLLSNALSAAELDLFMAGLHQAEAEQVYADVLEKYFDKLIDQQEAIRRHEPFPTNPTDS